MKEKNEILSYWRKINKVINMKLTDYQQALILIQKLEKRFGSVNKVPDSHPDMQEIHRLLPIERQDVDYRRIRWLNEKGYPNFYIAQVTQHSKASIGNYFSAHNIKSKKSFKYLVQSSASTDAYYGTSLTHLATLLLHEDTRNNTAARAHLTKHGFSIRTGFYLWYQLPDGAYYALNYLDNFAVKNGLDSYIYPDE